MPGVRAPERDSVMAQVLYAVAVGRSNMGMHPTAGTVPLM